jgi:hypothetical protein
MLRTEALVLTGILQLQIVVHLLLDQNAPNSLNSISDLLVQQSSLLRPRESLPKRLSNLRHRGRLHKINDGSSCRVSSITSCASEARHRLRPDRSDQISEACWISMTLIIYSCHVIASFRQPQTCRSVAVPERIPAMFPIPSNVTCIFQYASRSRLREHQHTFRPPRSSSSVGWLV